MPSTQATTVPTRVQVLTALAAGVATTAYYATPDFISSRRARGWVKAGLALASAATSVPAFRADQAAARASAQEAARAAATEAAATSEPVPESDVELGGGVKAAIVAFGAVAVAGTVAGAVAIERWVYRKGEARAAAGKALPHTGPALLYGVVAAGLSLAPDVSRWGSARR
ncbi:hypothetical protein DNL40_04435 [Xylanimonas oleitrophica]|uniref:Peptidase S9 n=1 Tax=Xylanimonas oleitrophica TaxID=2607479 RepID=A0A2W5Y775_9MICO|nr:hypothetical protein [Xylanimonas oleitrophica]PZR54184.1 hypothetical protein DNL40_04435 [Xylanimonas oleitrophica]